MTERERQLKKRIQLIVASAIAMFFCLLVTLTVQLSVRANQRAMERKLKATQAELQRQIDDEKTNIDYYQTQKFIEEYILKELGYGRDGSIIKQG